MISVSVVFCASNLGGPEPRVLARFVTDDRGLHMERFERREGRWRPDALVAGFLTGQDDWAERITASAARHILSAWGFKASLLSAPATEAVTT